MKRFSLLFIMLFLIFGCAEGGDQSVNSNTNNQNNINNNVNNNTNNQNNNTNNQNNINNQTSCGNGIKEVGEECDGTDLGGKECSDVIANATGGTLTCGNNCIFDTSECETEKPPVCGDGVRDPGEECDDGGNNSDTTPDACRTNCRQAYCGDGVKDSGEECDGTDLGGQDCANFDPLLYNGGSLSCDSGCILDPSNCTEINYAHEVWEDCNSQSSNPNYECKPHNQQPSDCFDPNGDGVGLCLQTCGTKSDCGYNLDCVLSDGNDNLCYFVLCGPGPASNGWPYTAPNSPCSFITGTASGWCVPLWEAKDEGGFCLENGTAQHGNSCDATDLTGEQHPDLSKICYRGSCQDIIKDGVGECVSYCDPVAVYNGAHAQTNYSNWNDPDTCPAGFNCVNFSSLNSDSNDNYYLFRTPDDGLCYPAQQGVTMDGSDIGYLLTCDVLTNRQIRNGQVCPSGTVCNYISLGSLLGACITASGNELGLGAVCSIGSVTDHCAPLTDCFYSDPLHNNMATKCLKYCIVDDMIDGMDDSDSACSTNEVCLSVSRFYTTDHNLPVSKDGQETETKPSPLGFCVPKL